MDDPDLQFHDAASRGKLRRVKQWIKQGSSINKIGLDGKTPLHCAVEKDHGTVIEYLIKHGADVEQKTADGKTPLHLAASLGHLKATKMLLSQEANLALKIRKSDTALHKAAQNGHLDVTKYLISQGAEVNKGENDGWTALHSAAQNGHLDVTKYLISQGAEVNKGNDNGWTALHFAGGNGHLDVTEYLISQGVEVNKEENDGWTALHMVAHNGHLDVTKYLISQEAEVNKGENYGWTALHSAAQNGHLDVTEYLISQGAEVNKGNDNGWTALHFAGGKGHLDVTKYLISQGAEVNKGGNDGWTALHFAAQNGHLDVTEYLISQGAEVNKRNNNGWTSLHFAARNGHLDVTKYLISQGAEVNKRDICGYTALIHSAVTGRVSVSNYLFKLKSEIDLAHTIYFTELHACSEKGDLDAVKNMVSRGAELDRADTFGWTALHIAAMNGHLLIVEYLLSQGAKVNANNSFDVTALHMAAEYGHIDVLKCLLKLGADVERVDDIGCTTLDYAVECGKVELIEYLISQGAEIDSVDLDGMTPLHQASSNGYLNITTCLLRHGADVNRRSVIDSIALHFDSQYGYYDVAKCLHAYCHEVQSLSADRYLVFKPHSENNPQGETKYFMQSIAGAAETAVGGMVTILRPHALCKLDFKDYIASKARRTVGSTPLDFAVQNGRLEVTRHLISRGADVNDANNVGWTALHFAAQMGHLHIAHYLLDAGSEINKGNVDDITPLHVAAFMGHSEITNLLLSRGADINKATTKKGSTALHVGAQNGHLDVISSLLSNGADVNKADKDSWTAMHIASQNGHLNITKLLLSHHADVKRSKNEGSTALHLSAANGHADVTRYLVEHGAETSVAKLNGRTALHLAAEGGHLHVTTYLLTQGIEVNMGDKDGYTPLHLSALKAHLEVAEVLLKEGARVDVRTTNGQTPLHLSSREGALKISNTLAERSKISGTLDQRDGSGFTAIHLATRNGQTAVVKTLVSHGADLNLQSNEGKTCLHEAIILAERSGRTVEPTPALHQVSSELDQRELPPEKALVFYLLDHGANLDIRDNEGKLPIHYATSEVVRQMIFSRLPSEEMVRSYRAEEPLPVLQTESVHVQHDAEQIELEKFGVSVSIPPGAVQQSDFRRITLTLVRDLPSIDIIDDESMACYGIRCDPPNMIFRQPVKIRIPHSTLVTNPDQVTPDIVSRKWDTNQGLPRTWRKTSSPGDKPPYCRLYKRHLELYIDHSAEWWVLIPLEQQVVRHQLICTPYLPDKIERGKDIDIHLHVHADLPGIEAELHEEEKQQSYHKGHRSVPFRVDSKSGDVTILFDHDDGIVENKVLSLKDLHRQLRHTVLFSMSPREDGEEFAVINITITQDGKLGISRSLAFVIRYSSMSMPQKAISENPSFFRAVEEVSQSDLHDIDIIKIAEMMTVDHFYDLGVALGFRFQQLDIIEYRRFRDRQQTIYDMLLTWRQRQASGPEAKETFVSLLKSFDLQAHEMAISDVGTVGDIPDKTLLAFASRVTSGKYFEIGMNLGFTKRELQHIEHRTSYNRKDANIQMLSRWKADQTSGPNAMIALKRVWESVQAASKAESSHEDNSTHSDNPQDAPSAGGNYTSRSVDTSSIALAPLEILARGPKAYKAYLDATQDSTKAVFRTRLMLVGQQRVGKTSLKKSLTGQIFDPQEGVTDGVEINIEVASTKGTKWFMCKKDEDVYDRALADNITKKLAESDSQGKSSSELHSENKDRKKSRPGTRADEYKKAGPAEHAETMKRLENGNQDTVTSVPQSEESDERKVKHEQTASAQEIAIQLPKSITLDDTIISIPQSEETDESKVKEEQAANSEVASMGAASDVETGAPMESHKEGHIPYHLAILVETMLRKKTRMEAEESGRTGRRVSDGLTLSIWDFAGHDVYYTTHQVFLTWRAVYILVFDLSRDLDSTVLPEDRGELYTTARRESQTELTCLEFINFWLCSIYTHAVAPSPKTGSDVNETVQQSPQIFIVGTHRQNVKGHRREKWKKIHSAFRKIRNSIKKRPFKHHVVTRYYAIENSLEDRDKELLALRKHIEEVATAEPYMGEKIPLRWLLFEEAVSASKANYITLEETKVLVRPIGIESEQELFTMLNFYHDLGTIVYYGDIEDHHSLLRDIVILNPQWLIDVFKQVISIPDFAKRDDFVQEDWNNLENRGILTEKLIKHLWHVQKEALTEIMLKFDLICEAPAHWHQPEKLDKSDDEDKDVKKSYYVPSRMTSDCSKRDIEQIKSSHDFYVDFRGFLPAGLFHRLMARAVKWSGIKDGKSATLFYRHINEMMGDHQAVLEMLPPHEATIKIAIFRNDQDKENRDVMDDCKHPDVGVVSEVVDFVKESLASLKQHWAKRIHYDFYSACPQCGKRKLLKDSSRETSPYCRKHRMPEDITSNEESIEVPSTTVRIDSSGGEIEIAECGIEMEVRPGALKAPEDITQHTESIEIPSKTVRIDSSGGEIGIEECGIRMEIPPGALKSPEDITLKPLYNTPKLDVSPDEMIASCGFQCSPRGLQFDKQITVTLSHCAVFSKHVPMEAVLYVCDSDDGRGVYKKNPIGSDCKVNQHSVDIRISHFTHHWVYLLALKSLLRQLIPPSKNIYITPFLKTLTPASHYDLRLFFCNADHELLEKINSSPGNKNYEMVNVQTEFRVTVNDGDVDVKLETSPGYPLLKPDINIEKTEILHNNLRHRCFDLNLKKMDTNVRVKLFIGQKKFRDLNVEQPTYTSTAPVEFVITKSVETTHVLGATSQTLSSDIEETELVRLAGKISPTDYQKLCIFIGIRRVEGDRVLTKHLMNYEAALIEILCEWNERMNGNNREVLAQKLQEADLDSLGRALLEGHFKTKPKQRAVADKE